MNKKGQALVEFVLILPIFIMLMLAVFDYVKIMQTRMSLEDTIENIVLSESSKLDDDIKLDIKTEEGVKTYSLSKKVDLVSPVVSAVLDKDYSVVVTRSVYE